MTPSPDPLQEVSIEQQLQTLGSSRAGLTAEEVSRRLEQSHPILGRSRRSTALLLFNQFRSPITLMLLFAAGLSFFLEERVDALIIIGIIACSALLGFWQEHSSARVMEKLLAIVRTTVMVVRDGRDQEVTLHEIVAGDVVRLSAGSAIPGDGVLIESKDLFVNEAALTGETFPAEKHAAESSTSVPGVTLAEGAERQRRVFLGTHVVSGTGLCVIAQTGAETEFGQVAGRLRLRPPETEFERGVRRFGYLLLEVTLLLVIGIFAINAFAHRQALLDSFLFSLALAVGLTPQLLPAIITVNLAHGARMMADCKVIVRRLAAIENFGSMNVLCSDKTGTLTEGVVEVLGACDCRGTPSDEVLRFAWLNAIHETGFVNPIDAALTQARSIDGPQSPKVDEVPYDFIRKRLSILVREKDENLLISKGAFDAVVSVCDRAELADGSTASIDSMRQSLQQLVAKCGEAGERVLGVATRSLGTATRVTQADEQGMTLRGYVIFRDPPKAGAAEAIAALKRLGISLKMITGDNRTVARFVAAEVGLAPDRLLTGSDLREMSNEALWHRATETEVFAEIRPDQKERIIVALRKAGHVVGYLGDGINDASALHAADVGISVDSAVDVAKEAADIVLLEHDLAVLESGVRVGRQTFANTLKYVFMATSANFGNMFSMAGASLFLPFLPLLPKQVLLMNVLTDLPEMTIATDGVDAELIARPRRWDIAFIRRFMLIFGTLSSLFDFAAFGVLHWLDVPRDQFRTAWFLESVISAALIVLVIRTRRPFLRSRPSSPLAWTTLGVVVGTVAIPFTPMASLLGFAALGPGVLLAMAGIVAAYVATAELAKALFYRNLAD